MYNVYNNNKIISNRNIDRQRKSEEDAHPILRYCISQNCDHTSHLFCYEKKK